MLRDWKAFRQPTRIIPWIGLSSSIILGMFIAAWFSLHSVTTSPACFATNACDGLTFRIVGEMLEVGKNPYDARERQSWLTSVHLNGETPPFDLLFQYPPPALPYFALRSIGPAQLNAVLTTVISTLLGLAALALLWRRDKSRLVWVTLAATWPVAWFNATLAQTGALAVALASGTLALGNRPMAAGVLLGALSFKPQYALPIALVAAMSQQWKLLKVAAGTTLALCVTSTVIWGLAIWPNAFAALGAANDTAPLMVSWIGPASQLAPEVVRLAVPVFLLGIMLVAISVRHANRLGWRWETTATGALGATLLFSPNTHPYDLALVLPALSLVVPRRPWLVPTVFAALTWLLALNSIMVTNRWGFTLLIVSTTIAWVAALVRKREPQ